MIAGIDLGTTHSLVGVMDSGFPVLIADESGQRLTPSAVWFAADSDWHLVGWPALEKRKTDPAQVVTSVKRLMGARVSEAALRVQKGDQSLRPEDVSALILSKLKLDIEKACGRVVDRAGVAGTGLCRIAGTRGGWHGGRRARRRRIPGPRVV